jgi:alpha-beta hydrolase superfamily lysophospholipase
MSKDSINGEQSGNPDMSAQVGAMTTKPGILLVHGAWHGPWNWQQVEHRLTAMGWQVQIADLPSVARREGPHFGLHDDAAIIRQQIADIDGPVVVVAHSYGGVAVSEGAADLPNTLSTWPPSNSTSVSPSSRPAAVNHPTGGTSTATA